MVEAYIDEFLLAFDFGASSLIAEYDVVIPSTQLVNWTFSGGRVRHTFASFRYLGRDLAVDFQGLCHALVGLALLLPFLAPTTSCQQAEGRSLFFGLSAHLLFSLLSPFALDLLQLPEQLCGLVFLIVTNLYKPHDPIIVYALNNRPVFVTAVARRAIRICINVSCLCKYTPSLGFNIFLRIVVLSWTSL